MSHRARTVDSSESEQAAALYEEALRYWDGDGVERDRARAVELLEYAADMGHPESQAFLDEIARLLGDGG